MERATHSEIDPGVQADMIAENFLDVYISAVEAGDGAEALVTLEEIGSFLDTQGHLLSECYQEKLDSLVTGVIER